MSRPTYQSKSHWPSQKEKTLRAFATYLALLDTADWMRSEMSAQLESFDLTMGGFRLFEMLYREGPMSVLAAAEKRHCKRQNLQATRRHRVYYTSENMTKRIIRAGIRQPD
jgi:chlorite dismutase